MMDYHAYSNTLILDIGQGVTKAGYQGEELPTLVFDTVIGKAKYTRIVKAE